MQETYKLAIRLSSSYKLTILLTSSYKLTIRLASSYKLNLFCKKLAKSYKLTIFYKKLASSYKLTIRSRPGQSQISKKTQPACQWKTNFTTALRGYVHIKSIYLFACDEISQNTRLSSKTVKKILGSASHNFSVLNHEIFILVFTMVRVQIIRHFMVNFSVQL